jgi:hypothetical protein
MIDLFETENLEITNSPLSQNITKDEQTIRVEIYKGEDDGWFLEIVDRDNNSTIWDDPFDSDQLALDEAMNAIDKKGLLAFVDPDSK